MSAPPAFAHSLAQTLRLAGRVVAAVIGGESLSTAFPRLVERGGDALRAAARDLSYRTLREYAINDALLAPLLQKPLARADLQALLLVAINELRASPAQAHTIVDQAVEAMRLARAPSIASVANGVLRSFLRQRDVLEQSAATIEAARWRHPQWWIDMVRAAYPADWQRVLEQSNTHPPMCLRVNLRKTSLERCRARLAAAGLAARALPPAALLLERPVSVERIPGFAEGEVSVQDAGAQLAAPLLELRDGMRVLDACAAPGGKSGHILESADCRLTALDDDPGRAARIGQNLARLGLAATVTVGDCNEPAAWWDGVPFERILLDAPCSASGVARRHPDIKWLRRPEDVKKFARQQSRMLDALWRVLAPGGKLLYATCSIFPLENALQVEAFARRHPDARCVAPAAQHGMAGGQLLPDPEHDGFFYAMLEKIT